MVIECRAEMNYAPLPSPFEWIHKAGSGFWIEPENFFIDPSRACAKAVITHAHADHFPAQIGQAFASHTTLALRREQFQGGAIATALNWKQKFTIGECELSLYPAGHVQGSAQILLKYRDKQVLFSGDLNNVASAHCEVLEIPQAHIDLVLCESTFGLQENHPDAEEELNRFFAAAGQRNCLISTYPLGKSQRICLLINRLFPEKKIFLYQDIYKVSLRCKELGYETGNYTLYRRKELWPNSGSVYLIPPRSLSGFAKDQYYFKAMATGWDAKKKYPWLQGQLALSDHSDANGLRQYISQLKPKAVYFHHGYPEKLETWCESEGIKVLKTEENP